MQVEKIVSKDEIEVLYIDYGNVSQPLHQKHLLVVCVRVLKFCLDVLTFTYLPLILSQLLSLLYVKVELR